MIHDRPFTREISQLYWADLASADLPAPQARKVLDSMGSTIEGQNVWHWTLDPFRFKFERCSDPGTLGFIVSIRTGDRIARVPYGQILAVYKEAYDRHLTDPKGIHSILWVSSREMPELEELELLEAVYPSATVTHSGAPLNLHSVSQFVEHYSTQDGTLVLFDTAQNVRLMMYLMQLQLPFAFLEKDNGGVLTVYFVIKGKLTVVRPVNG